MTLVQMSLTGGLIILCAVVLRALFMNHLPKRTFIALWVVALVRMLVPFSIPFKLSLYSAARNIPEQGAVMGAPEEVRYFVRQAVSVRSLGPAPTVAPMRAEAVAAASPGESVVAASFEWPPIDWVMVIYLLGAFLLCAYLLSAYVYLRREYRSAREIRDGFVADWLEGQRIRRHVRVLVSRDIASPITYGLFRPRILLPEALLTDERQLVYVLTHEMTHIRRFDAPMKLLFAAGLCVHWFNPLAWVMYVLYNRDVELSCDEQVVKLLGTGSRADYASLLLDMQTGRSKLTPLSSGFSRHCIKERIVAIMKYKKTSALAALLAVLIVASVTCALATSAAEPTPKPTEGIKRTAPIIVPEAFTDPRLAKIYSQTDLPNVKCLGWMDEANRENSTILSRIYYYLTCEEGDAKTYRDLSPEAHQLMADYQAELNKFIASLTSSQIFDDKTMTVDKDGLLALLRSERDRLTKEMSKGGLRVRAINFTGEVLTRDAKWDTFYFTSDFYDNMENPPAPQGLESGGGIEAGKIAVPGIVMDWGIQTDGSSYISWVSDDGWEMYANEFRDPETGVSFRYVPVEDDTLVMPMKNDIEISPDNGATWWRRYDEKLAFYHDDFPGHVIDHIPMDNVSGEANWSRGWCVRGDDSYTPMAMTIPEKIAEAIHGNKIEGIHIPALEGGDSVRYMIWISMPVNSPFWQEPNLAQQYLSAQGEYDQIYKVLIISEADGGDEQTDVYYVGTKKDGTMEEVEFKLGEGEQLPRFSNRYSMHFVSGDYMWYSEGKDRIADDLRANNFERVLTLKVPDYEKMTVAELDKMIQEEFTKEEIEMLPQALSLDSLPWDSEDQTFLSLHVRKSAEDINWKANGKKPDEMPFEIAFCDAWKALKQYGATSTSVIAVIGFEVIDPAGITTGERAVKINDYMRALQEFIRQLPAKDLYGPELQKILEAKGSELTKELSTDAFKLILKEYDLRYTYDGKDYVDGGLIRERD